ncbi:MAG: sigma-70 family RNA polymerase sigma factor [Flammeovirgaceae bacterium]
MMVFEQIYAQFSQELYRFILKRVKDEAVAKDLLQDVFIKIIEKAHQLTDKSKLKYWIYRITSNEITTYYRQQKQQHHLKALVEFEETKEHDLTPLEDCLIGFIDDMQEEEKYLVQQVEFEGRSQKELAEELGLGYSNVRSKIQRARKKLRERLLACCKQQLKQGGVACGELCDACD